MVWWASGAIALELMLMFMLGSMTLDGSVDRDASTDGAASSDQVCPISVPESAGSDPTKGHLQALGTVPLGTVSGLSGILA